MYLTKPGEGTLKLNFKILLDVQLGGNSQCGGKC